jgi:hypothetical protein
MNHPAAGCEVSIIEKTTLVILRPAPAGRLDRESREKDTGLPIKSGNDTFFVRTDAEHRGLKLQL